MGPNLLHCLKKSCIRLNRHRASSGSNPRRGPRLREKRNPRLEPSLEVRMIRLGGNTQRGATLRRREPRASRQDLEGVRSPERARALNRKRGPPGSNFRRATIPGTERSGKRSISRKDSTRAGIEAEEGAIPPRPRVRNESKSTKGIAPETANRSVPRLDRRIKPRGTQNGGESPMEGGGRPR